MKTRKRILEEAEIREQLHKLEDLELMVAKFYALAAEERRHLLALLFGEAEASPSGEPKEWAEILKVIQ